MKKLRQVLHRLTRIRLKAFTLLDSLLTLFVTSFVVVGLAISINHIFARVEEQLFFADFEQLYLETQSLSVAQGQASQLQLSEKHISGDYRHISLPEGVQFEGNQTLVFDAEGGNSTLAKLVFYTKDKEIKYQLYLGSGKYKKTESRRLHTP